MRIRTYLTALCILALPAAAAERPAAPVRYTIIHAGTLLAMPGQRPATEMSIIVRNDRIERIVSGYAAADAAGAGENDSVTVVDLSGKFVMPGVMDAHVHLRQEAGDGTHARRGRSEVTYADKAFNAVLYARRTLAAGFTTVRDLGSDDQSVFAVRDAINGGRMTGPRILAAGSGIGATGGHGDGAVIEGDQLSARLMEGVCDGADECTRAVRFQHKLGADVIKFMASGGFSGDQNLLPQLYPEEINAIVSATHQLGMKAAVHVYPPESIQWAIDAGVDSIEHGFLLSDENLRSMKRRGTFLVPTLSAASPPPFIGMRNSPSEQLRAEARGFERAYAMGVRIAFGTDAGTFNHGENAKEFDLMVKFGMTPADAIVAATLNTAELFGLADEAGSLEPGKIADIIAVTGNPLEDITAMHAVDFVMKSGKVAKENGRMADGFAYLPFGSDVPRRPANPGY